AIGCTVPSTIERWYKYAPKPVCEASVSIVMYPFSSMKKSFEQLLIAWITDLNASLVVSVHCNVLVGL
ncbi:hypothetical protein, partial [Salmonella enterica]|uniref:hypothetical protein n=1 Tax=Salmonella enterica TaxID=28901 RepID=UPI003F9F2B26